MTYDVVGLGILAGAVSPEAYPFVRKQIAVLDIVTEYDPKPIPQRSFDWTAIDARTHDGAEDSSTRGQIGYGATEAGAIADLKMILGDA